MESTDKNRYNKTYVGCNKIKIILDTWEKIEEEKWEEYTMDEKQRS